jgi:hypothetical protein
MSLALHQHPFRQETGAPQLSIRIEAFAIDRVTFADGSDYSSAP